MTISSDFFPSKRLFGYGHFEKGILTKDISAKNVKTSNFVKIIVT